jgi:hypothetical protein
MTKRFSQNHKYLILVENSRQATLKVMIQGPRHSNVCTVTNIKLNILKKTAEIVLINVEVGPAREFNICFHFLKCQFASHHVSAHPRFWDGNCIPLVS